MNVEASGGSGADGGAGRAPRPVRPPSLVDALIPLLSLAVLIGLAAVLGVPVLTYLPYAFFNVIHPLLAVLYGYIGFRVVCTPPSPGESGRANQAVERVGV